MGKTTHTNTKFLAQAIGLGATKAQLIELRDTIEVVARKGLAGASTLLALVTDIEHEIKEKS